MSVAAHFCKTMNEAKKHRLRMQEALDCLQSNPDDIACMDQLIYRFSKCQDTLGQRVFRAFLEAIGETKELMTFIDILNRMEKFEILDRDVWEDLRNLRNEIAHTYDDDPETTGKLIEKIRQSMDILDNVIQNMMHFSKEQGIQCD